MSRTKKGPNPWDNITKEELFKRFVISQHYIKVLEETFNPTSEQLEEISHKLAVSLGVEPDKIEDDENKD